MQRRGAGSTVGGGDLARGVFLLYIIYILSYFINMILYYFIPILSYYYILFIWGGPHGKEKGHILAGAHPFRSGGAPEISHMRSQARRQDLSN